MNCTQEMVFWLRYIEGISPFFMNALSERSSTPFNSKILLTYLSIAGENHKELIVFVYSLCALKTISYFWKYVECISDVLNVRLLKFNNVIIVVENKMLISTDYVNDEWSDCSLRRKMTNWKTCRITPPNE